MPINKEKPIIVIGTGSVGVRFVNELLFRQPGACIKVFGGEEQQPYSRENLSKLLSGEVSKESLYSRSKIHESKDVRLYINNPIVSIDANKREVFDSLGEVHSYSELVLAVGSSPRMLNIEGIDLNNVLTFRNVKDAELLKTRQIGSRRTVVVGGGSVGLDTAYAMNKHNTEVIVIESSTRLMSQLLDDHASVYLRLFLDDLGIEVRNQSNVARIEGKTKVEQVVLEDGEVIPCDTVIVSIGINPNADLAESIGLKVNRGIVINDQLQTSNKNIYAIGECAEHRGRVYAIVQPGFDQASVLAKRISGGKAKYTGTITASALGVVEYPVLSIGENGDSEDSKEVMYRDIKRMVYRKLVLKSGRLHGVIATGPWKQGDALHELVEKKHPVWPWQRKHFEKTGQL
ncbi:MAG: FAD-dependent oxidoreductase [Cocleimonas sp.]